MLDVNELADTVKAELYPVVIQDYEAQPAFYPQLTDLRPITEMGNFYGIKGNTLEAVGEFRDRADGQEAEHDSPGKAYTWQAAVRQKTRMMTIPQRMLDSLGSAGRIVDYVQRQAAGWGVQAMRAKDTHVAGMLQKGTLTAGSAEFFDNSYLDDNDPNPKYIYDGLPFFDTAHTLSDSSTTLSNHTASSALTRANLETVLTTIRQTNAIDDRGNRIQLMPNALVVPSALEFTARRIVNSTVSDADMQVNPVQGSLQVIVNPYLTDDTDSWYVAQVGAAGVGGGIRFYDSGAPVIESQYDSVRKVLHVVAEIHFAAAVTDWRFWYAANKAAS
jgi:hypothetical protein